MGHHLAWLRFVQFVPCKKSGGINRLWATRRTGFALHHHAGSRQVRWGFKRRQVCMFIQWEWLRILTWAGTLVPYVGPGKMADIYSSSGISHPLIGIYIYIKLIFIVHLCSSDCTICWAIFCRDILLGLKHRPENGRFLQFLSVPAIGKMQWHVPQCGAPKMAKLVCNHSK